MHLDLLYNTCVCLTRGRTLYVTYRACRSSRSRVATCIGGGGSVCALILISYLCLTVFSLETIYMCHWQVTTHTRHPPHALCQLTALFLLLPSRLLQLLLFLPLPIQLLSQHLHHLLVPLVIQLHLLILKVITLLMQLHLLKLKFIPLLMQLHLPKLLVLIVLLGRAEKEWVIMN